jgi:hypothetical protein
MSRRHTIGRAISTDQSVHLKPSTQTTERVQAYSLLNEQEGLNGGSAPENRMSPTLHFIPLPKLAPG